MKKLDFRKSHRSSYSHLPRMASFIGTSNRKALLTDPSGSRRYFFAEVKEKIDCSPLEHKQLFAQLKAELDEGKRYWFSAAEESELKLRNQAYYALPTEAEMILHCFRLPEKGEGFKLSKDRYFFEICKIISSFSYLCTEISCAGVSHFISNIIFYTLYFILNSHGNSRR